MPEPGMMVDVHAHFLTDAYVAAAAPRASDTPTVWRVGRPGQRRSTSG